MDDRTLDLIDNTIDVLLLSLLILQKISKKSQAEILDMIKAEGKKTDKLIAQLK